MEFHCFMISGSLGIVFHALCSAVAYIRFHERFAIAKPTRWMPTHELYRAGAVSYYINDENVFNLSPGLSPFRVAWSRLAVRVCWSYEIHERDLSLEVSPPSSCLRSDQVFQLFLFEMWILATNEDVRARCWQPACSCSRRTSTIKSSCLTLNIVFRVPW